MRWENDTFALVQRRAMVYSSKDINFVDFCRDSAKYASKMAFAAPKVESLWFLYQAEGLPKNISIDEFCTKHGVHSIVLFIEVKIWEKVGKCFLSNLRQTKKAQMAFG